MSINLIEQLREKIDVVDIRLLDLLRERIKISAQIGEIKQIENTPVIDSAREENLFAVLEKEASARNLDAGFVRNIWQEILKQSYRAQTEERLK
ncbi:MAG: hypothetical protein E4H13_09530 [Calditrichales bacterium]|nr:MAG: hypothetical protein E4H13_09530 [Calditrichales bacterium]